MPKQLINAIGLIVCIGIVALAVALVAVPMYLGSVSTNATAAQVKQTNDIYQIQVDALRAESERMPEIEESVAGLRAQIPATNRLDEVFELVARSASESGVDLLTVTAGEDAPFIVRTDALAIGEVAEEAPPAAPADDAADSGSDPAVTPEPTEEPAADPSTGSGGAAEAPAGDGRVQVDFSITLNAQEFGQVIAFLDALREGPRLLSTIQSRISPTGTGFDVNVSALTFVMPEA